MREILFRGKRIYKNKWVYGNLITDKYGEHHIIEPKEIEEDGHHLRIDSDSPVFFHQDTIGQYTGLKDKNGVKIFEGDIVKCVELIYEVFREYVSEVYLDIGCWLVDESKTCSVDLYLYDNSNPTKMPLTEIEVIGNIYDNPEMEGLTI